MLLVGMATVSYTHLDVYKRQTLTSSDEGEVFWVERGALGRCRLSADFQEMLKIFECCDLSEFYYYRDGEAWAHALL